VKTCPACGCRVYEYGCVNCNEQDYIDMQWGDVPEDETWHGIMRRNPPQPTDAFEVVWRKEKAGEVSSPQPASPTPPDTPDTPVGER